jgi:hypothetical protein
VQRLDHASLISSPFACSSHLPPFNLSQLWLEGERVCAEPEQVCVCACACRVYVEHIRPNTLKLYIKRIEETDKGVYRCEGSSADGSTLERTIELQTYRKCCHRLPQLPYIAFPSQWTPCCTLATFCLHCWHPLAWQSWPAAAVLTAAVTSRSPLVIRCIEMRDGEGGCRHAGRGRRMQAGRDQSWSSANAVVSRAAYCTAPSIPHPPPLLPPSQSGAYCIVLRGGRRPLQRHDGRHNGPLSAASPPVSAAKQTWSACHLSLMVWRAHLLRIGRRLIMYWLDSAAIVLSAICFCVPPLISRCG